MVDSCQCNWSGWASVGFHQLFGVPVGVGVAVAVAVGVTVREAVGVGVTEEVAVGITVREAVGVAVAEGGTVASGVKDGWAVGGRVGAVGAVGLRSPVVLTKGSQTDCSVTAGAADLLWGAADACEWRPYNPLTHKPIITKAPPK